MYIVYAEGLTSNFLYEEKKEAFEAAKAISTEHGISAKIYKANLIAVAETAVTIKKIRKQKTVKKEVFEAAKTKLIERKKKVEAPEVFPSHLPEAVREAAKKKPVLMPELAEIAKDIDIPEDTTEDIPLGARCALDRNMAVGRKKGPTGEFVYLCVDCMGAING